MSRLLRFLTLAAATAATAFVTLVASELVDGRERPPPMDHLLVALGTLIGFALGLPLAVGFLWRTDLRRSVPLVALLILATAALVSAFGGALLGAFAGLAAGLAGLQWCNVRASPRPRSALDGSGRSAENAPPSIS